MLQKQSSLHVIFDKAGLNKSNGYLITKIFKCLPSPQAVGAHMLWEEEAIRSLWVQDQPGLQSEFQGCQSYYTEKILSQKTKTKKRKKSLPLFKAVTS